MRVEARKYLYDINLLGEFTAGKQFTDHKEYSMLRAAVERKFEIIGEALSKLWRWDALQAARTATTEEDLLTELLGRERTRGPETAHPCLRVDIQLRAGLEYGKWIAMPSRAAWFQWRREAVREPDDDPYPQLSAMFLRVRAALHAWREVMDHLT